MSEHQRDTAFLKELLLQQADDERRRLGESLHQAQDEEQCIKRALSMMLQLVAFCLAGLAYTTLLLQHIPDRYFDLIVKLFSVVTLAAVISVAWYSVMWLLHRNEMNRKREEGRQYLGRTLRVQ